MKVTILGSSGQIGAYLTEYLKEKGHTVLEFDVVKGNKHGKPLDIDLRPSNLCNLKCRSCNTVWSTEIQKEVLANPEIQGWSHWDTISFSTQKWKKRTKK